MICQLSLENSEKRDQLSSILRCGLGEMHRPLQIIKEKREVMDARSVMDKKVAEELHQGIERDLKGS